MIEYNTFLPSECYLEAPDRTYDRSVKIRSFNVESEEFYHVNLYALTCTCKDFEQMERPKYAKNDVRRYCKHLMREYKSKIGVGHLSELCKCFFNDGFGLKEKFISITLDSLSHPIAINFEWQDGWWNIYFPSETGTYKKYGYHPQDERFSYDEKPIGYVSPLRSKLKALSRELTNKKVRANTIELRNRSVYNIENKDSDGLNYYPPPFHQSPLENGPEQNTQGIYFLFGFIVVCLLLMMLKC